MKHKEGIASKALRHGKRAGMKKIDSNNFGGKVIGVGIILLLSGGALLGLNRLWSSEVIAVIAKVLLVVGGCVLTGFAALLSVELKQDKKINSYYNVHKNRKVEIGNGKYECGACGNRGLRKESSHCTTCGCKFEGIEYRTPQEIIDSDTRHSTQTGG